MLADGLTFDTTEMYGLRLGVLADNLHHRKAVGRDQMCVGRIPDGPDSRRRIVQFHTHTLLPRTLPGKCINGRRLRDLCGSFENLLAVLVNGGYTDDKVAVMHGRIFDPDGEFISGKDHSDEVDVVATVRT